MSQLEVTVSLEFPRGEAISQTAPLRGEIQNELVAAAKQPDVTLSGPQETRPEGVQGLPEIIQWVLQIASNDPQTLLYPLSYALKEILDHYKSREDRVKVVIIVPPDKRIDLSRENLDLDEEIDQAIDDP